MSNEEIVLRIQSGEQELYEDLWRQVERLAAWKAKRVCNAMDGCTEIEFDDLYNSGYLALVAAVESYQPERGAFSTWFMFYLKTTFAEATGYRTQASKNDPLRHAVSLSTPMGDDPDGGNLGDLIPDPDGQSAMESVEEKLWREQLHKTMEDVLRGIPEQCCNVLRHRYYIEQTNVEAGRELGIAPELVQRMEKKGLQLLRMPQNIKRLLPFHDFNYYGSTSLQAFRHNNASVQEMYLLIQDGRRESAQAHR